MRNFRKYEVWELSHQLTIEIYKLTKSFPDSERYQLISQMQRAAYSIPSNFSEGCGRESEKEFKRFITISMGSAHELEYFMILASDLKYVDQDVSESIQDDINKIKAKLFNLSRKLKG